MGTTIRNIVLAAALACGAVGISATGASAAEPPATAAVKGKATVVATENDPILRLEGLVIGLPANSDLYAVAQRQGESDLYKVRGQMLPLEMGKTAFGLTAQRTVTNAGTKDEYGFAARIKGGLGGTRVKFDGRYFPAQAGRPANIDWYGTAEYPSFFADILGNVTSRGKYNLRAGMGFKLGSGGHFLLGPEIGLSGGNGASARYVGLAGSCRF